MNYDNIVKTIWKGLVGKFKIVTQPDHPMMFGGPDVIAGSHGLLYAFFVQKMVESDHPGNLLIRLAQSRLALPTHTACFVVVIQTSQTLSVIDSFEQNFDKIIEITDISTLARTKHQKRSSDIQELTKVRRYVNSRTALLFEAGTRFQSKPYTELSPTRLLQEFQQKSKANPVDVPLWVKPGAVQHYSRFLKSASVVSGAAMFLKKRSIRSTLQPVINFGIRSGNIMDKGIPYPKKDSLYALFVDTLPQVPHDPFKPIRCAALSGWMMVPAKSLGEYEQVVSEVERKIKRIK